MVPQDTRNSNFEALRLITMLMIIMHHFVLYGSIPYDEMPSLMQITLTLLSSMGKVGVNLFVMISAYFIVSKPFKMRRIISMILDLYSLSILTLILIGYLRLQPTLSQWYNLILPFPHGYWFVTAYVLMLLLAPFLDIVLASLSYGMMTKVLLFLTVGMSIMPTLRLGDVVYTNVTWFAYIYSLIGWYKKYNIQRRLSRHFTLRGIGLTLLSIVGVVVWFSVSAYMLPDKLGYAMVQLGQNSILPLILSLLIFNYVVQLPSHSYSWINQLAGLTFGVYLIHEQPIIRDWLWPLVDNQRITNPLWMILYCIGTSALVMVVCMAIEWIRQRIVSQPINYLAKKWGQICDQWLENFLQD